MGTRTEDIVRIEDIKDIILEIEGYTKSTSYERFVHSEQLRESVMTLLLQIGGAAAQLSDEFKEEHGEVDWEVFKGLQYAFYDETYEMDMNTVWYIIHEDFPELREQLSDMLTNLQYNEELDENYLNEEDKRDNQERYFQKEKTVEPGRDIKEKDNTPDRSENRKTEDPDDHLIEAETDKVDGPFGYNRPKQ